MVSLLTSPALFGLVLTLVTFCLGIWLRHKTGIALLNPLIVSITLCILFLVGTDTPYETYAKGTAPLSLMLTPATVCYALPLYHQWSHLKACPKALLVGTLAGSCAGLVCILLLGRAFGLGAVLVRSLLPKSITTAIGIDLSAELGGIVAITVAAIIVTGNLGNIFAESLCRLFKIHHPIAKGLAIGTSTHAVGTVKAMEMGELIGAISSLAIVIAGLITVLLAPLAARLI